MRARFGKYLAADLATACRGTLVLGDPTAVFTAVSTDSRDIAEGDLFIPIQGERFDGHDFMIPALEAGARGSLCHRDINRDLFHNLPNSVLIQVQDTRLALSTLASTHRFIHSIPLIAVTGSSGKTTVKEMIAAVLGRSHRPLVSKANLNNTIGLPMTVLDLNDNHDRAVVEAGINMENEMDLLAAAARPDVAVITTVGPVHLEGLKTVENVAREKFKLAEALGPAGTVVVPHGDRYLAPLYPRTKGKILTFGVDEGDFRAEKVSFGDKTEFEMIGPQGSIHISLPMPGKHSVLNALAAAAAASAVDVSLDDVASGLESFTPPDWRMEILSLSGNRKLIRDCYNANPQSMKTALEVLVDRARSGRSLAILGDMMELGDRSEELHEDVGRYAALAGVDTAIFVGGFAGAFERGFLGTGVSGRTAHATADKTAAWNLIRERLGDYDAILVKGSRRTRMETLAESIMKE